MLNLVKKVGLGISIISSLLLCSFNVYAEGTLGNVQTTIVYVTAENGLNIRPTPGTEISPIDTVANGTQLQLVEKDIIQNWSSIKYNGRLRYVSSKYITEIKEKQQSVAKKYLGNYRITFYCNCSQCCGQWAGGPTASGVYPEAGVTIATGSQFTYGTKLMINDHIYTVQDRGVGNGCIDIYCSSHSQACAGGMYYTDVYLVD